MTRADSIDVEIAVVGGGVMGASAAWSLARRGVSVALLERHEPGHRFGASHGAVRNFNPAYTEPHYVALLRRSLTLWRELEDDASEPLLEQLGFIDRGSRPELPGADDQAGTGFPFERIPGHEASERWPLLRFEDDEEVRWFPDGGRVAADRSVAALHRRTAAHGGIVRHGADVTSVTAADDDRVRVEARDTETGEPLTVTARRAIVTVGAWTEQLLGTQLALPRLVVTQEQPAHFAARPEFASQLDALPSFNHRSAADGDWWPSGVYGMHTPGEGIKVGWHGVGPVTDPDRRSFAAEPAQLEQLRAYARQWVPGADADAAVAISCTYTTTSDSSFLLDRSGPIIVGAGFSGHGFKFATGIGEVLADLASGGADDTGGGGAGRGRQAVEQFTFAHALRHG